MWKNRTSKSTLRNCILVMMVFLELLSYCDKQTCNICAIFRNEARFLREWIEFHRLVGVEHFYLYNDRSTDNFAEVLKPYIEQGTVTFTSWPAQKGQHLWNQICAYNDCLKKLKHTDGWLAFIDIDEFIFPMQGTNINNALHEFSSYRGLSIFTASFEYPWIELMPENSLVTKSFTKCTYDFQFFTKNLIQPKYTKRVAIHEATFEEGFFPVNTRGQKTTRHDDVSIGGKNHEYAIDKIRINHYRYRDLKDLVDRIQLRIPMYCKPGNVECYMSIINEIVQRCTKPNKVDDFAIQKYLPELERAIKG